MKYSDKLREKTKKKRVWEPKLRAETFSDKREKRNRTRKAQIDKAIREYDS